MAKNFYAVKRGFDQENNKEIHDQIFETWDETKKYVKNDYENPRYKGFMTKEEAIAWLESVDEQDQKNKERKEKLHKNEQLVFDMEGNVHGELEGYDPNEQIQAATEKFSEVVHSFRDMQWNRSMTISVLSLALYRAIDETF